MKILHYNGLDIKKIPNYKKVSQAIMEGNFARAQVKKIGDNLYRARLNDKDRLLFSLYLYENETYALILEWIKNHDYDKSRFLRGGAKIDDAQIEVVTTPPKPEAELNYVNPKHQDFAWLGKCISFDDVQQGIYQTNPPLVIIGSAGSGKTALMLEKLKQMTGDVLYVSLSSYLVKNAHDLYYSGHYSNEQQAVDFFNYQELLESIHVPQGKPIEFSSFKQWFMANKQNGGIKDVHKLFEEFRGVLTSSDMSIGKNVGYLSQEDYQSLGVRQSIYLEDERQEVYQLFQKYLQYANDGEDTKNSEYYDTNLTSHQWLKKVTPKYDFVVVDEVQDFTSIQLYLILQTLRHSGQFLLCGDANQIVHPNFFSWAKVKSLFYHQKQLQGGDELIRILHTNYRNAPEVTQIANRILQIKNMRFGSIDKESHYLVESNGHVQGNARLWQDKTALLKEINEKTRLSTQFAVIVLHDEQKAMARQHFNTPLIFSIQEAKGLEYENVILYNFVSSEEQRFLHIAQGVDAEALDGESLNYSRNKDKTDKSLEVYKFYINALYVALTRAIKNVYWIESRHKHPLFNLLKVAMSQSDTLDIEANNSSVEEWQLEAQKLAMQGKTEQAKQIRQELLQEKKVNWTVYDNQKLIEVIDKAIVKGEKKAGILLLEYAQVYNNLNYYNGLQQLELKAAQRPLHYNHKDILQKYYYIYNSNNLTHIEKQVDKFGLEYRDMFNRTPLMNAVWIGNVNLVKRLIERGADIEAVDNHHHYALQIALQMSIVTPRETQYYDDNMIEHNVKYAKQILPEIYDLIAPDSISLQTQGRLVKLESYTMEYYLVNMMLAMLPNKAFSIGDSECHYPTFETRDLLSAIAHMPVSVLPEYRRRRAYISSILARNEVSRQDSYNRQLFQRIKRGHYILHPELQIKIADEWHQLIDYKKYTVSDNRLFKAMLWSDIYDVSLAEKIPDFIEKYSF